MKIFRILLLILVAEFWLLNSALAADRITATVTITNAPTTNAMTFVITTTASSTRTWTNSVFNTATQILTNSTVNGIATNLQNHLQANPPAGVVPVQTGGSNIVTLYGSAGTPLTVSGVGAYFSVSYATQAVTSALSVRVPYTVEAATVRTQVASQLVEWLELAANTNPVSQVSTFASELVGKTNAQTVTGAKDFSSAAGTWRGTVTGSPGISGTVANLTNGVYESPILNNPAMTNGFNYGDPFRSPGTGTASEQFGTQAQATNDYATAIGFDAVAGGSLSTALGEGTRATLNDATAVGANAFATKQGATGLGRSALADGPSSVAIGFAAGAIGIGSIGIGTNAYANRDGSIAIGSDALADHTNSTAIGPGSATTKNNQIRLGVSTMETSVAGSLQVDGGAFIAGGVTNLTVRGTNQFPVGSDIAFGRFANSSLATGNNAGILVGTNVFVEVSGPAGAFAINGIAGGRDGKLIILLNQTGQDMTLAHQSGVEPTAANRIITMTGADRATTGNGAATLIYSGAASRWILISFDP